MTQRPEDRAGGGAQIVLDPNQPVPMDMVGHVTSSYWSAELGRSIALAVIQGGRSLQGKTVHVPMPDKVHAATITGMVFVDPENTRLSA
ncbi:glycine cleavage T C-terminal barrel domain-containing protein [Azospirillum sp. B506]|uniref:glycine cleavage T C-terminal barrel domain-containing protein n=1 Tax=Azospirillum sp. B506 TaxID=137721 RepID=UPI00034A3CAA|nr:glycine cleavage T C-terminal barrel domain-containing protein [Azospirillum sp. B506]